MMIREFARLTGVSVRTLHYYDEIGLLKPARVDRETGYRFYDEASLFRMQEILFYRELDVPLKRIEAVLSSPGYDRSRVLREQKHLLTLKKERLERLIASIDDARSGETMMNALSKHEIEQYKAEAKAAWGDTDAYREHQARTRHYRAQTWNALAEETDRIMAAVAARMQARETPDSPAVQSLVAALQSHITENYYRCTSEILAGLGQMYVADERFKRGIDRHAAGTAAFLSEAIRIYCGR